jgi:prophage DNA circulation protein
MFLEEIEQSLLGEHTNSVESSSSDETDSCGIDDLTVGEVNFAECSENESDNVQFATGCSVRSDSKCVFAWEDMTNYVGQREQFVDNYGPQNEAQNETHCAKMFKMFF